MKVPRAPRCCSNAYVLPITRLPQWVISLLIALLWGFAYYAMGTMSGLLLGLIAAATIGTRTFIPAFNLRRVWALFILAHFIGFAWFGPALSRYSEWNILVVMASLLAFAGYGALQFVLFVWLAKNLSKTPLRSLSLDLPLAWCAVELVFFRPFDWSLSHTLTAAPFLIQLADIGGAPFVSFLLMWIVSAVADGVGAQAVGRVYRLSAAPSLLLVVMAYGWIKLARAQDAPPIAKVLLVNANTAPSHQFSGDRMRAEWRTHIALTRAKLDAAVDFVLWPESAVLEPISDLTADEQSTLLTAEGMSFAVPVLFGTQRTLDDLEIANVVALQDAARGLEQYYVKQVPFPLAEGDVWARFRGTRSEGRHTFSIPVRNGSVIKVLPLICFESTVANVVRSRVRADLPDVLIEFSNLNWFEGTIASRQHQVLATWRAIEHRRPLVRMVNAAPSAIIASDGRVQTVPYTQSGSAEIMELPRGQSTLTLYARWGSFLYGAILVVTMIALLHGKGRGKVRGEGVPRQVMVVALVMLGCIFSVGTYFHNPLLQGIGITGGFSPNPFVFNRFEGIHYWSHEFDLEVLYRDLTRSTHKVDATIFEKLPGPHHYHMAFAVPFAFAPIYDRQLIEEPLRRGLCGVQGSPGVLAQALALTKPIASVRIGIKEAVPTDENAEVRTWSMRVVCRGAQ